MLKQNKLALIIAYYLSRFDRLGYLNLGYKNFNEAVNKIGEILSVKATTVKNMRDEFDPYHNNIRVGWYQKDLTDSRKMVMQSFCDKNEQELREIIFEILKNKEFRESKMCDSLLSVFSDKKDSYTHKAIQYTSRGITGKAAEQYYIDYYKKYKKPIKGVMRDRREDGCGYDFEIKNATGSYCIEVKGLAGKIGGVLFTNKEWEVAKTRKKDYYLVLVREIESDCKIFIIQDPTNKFKATKNIFTTVSVSWGVAHKLIENVVSINKTE